LAQFAGGAAQFRMSGSETTLQLNESHTMKTLARIGAVLSFAFCLLGGLWILSRSSFSAKDDVLATAIGFYFVGKAFFVGPMLWLASGKCCTQSDGK